MRGGEYVTYISWDCKKPTAWDRFKNYVHYRLCQLLMYKEEIAGAIDLLTT
jgi:hypothetical protein